VQKQDNIRPVARELSHALAASMHQGLAGLTTPRAMRRSFTGHRR
jgi:hypothetical protein